MKNRYIHIIVLLLMPIAAISGNIDNVIKEVKINNLDLKSLEHDYQANAAILKSANNLPDPEIDGEYLFGDNTNGSKWGVGVSQSFEWPGIYSARSKANSLSMTALLYLNKQKELTILLDTKKLCIDLINLNKQIKNQIDVKNEMVNLSNAYNKGFSNGEINILDMNKLKIELLNTNQRIAELSIQRDVVIESLKAINGGISLNGNIIKELSDYSAEEFKPLQYYEIQYAEKDPENLYYVSTEDANKKNLSVSKMQWFPGFSVGYKHSNELGERFNGLTASISIPVFSNRNKVAAAKARIIADSFTKENVSVSKQSEIAASYMQISRLSTQIMAYKEILSDTNNLSILRRALDGGQINLLQYLMETRYFIEANSKLIEMEYQYQLLLSNLNKYSLIEEK